MTAPLDHEPGCWLRSGELATVPSSYRAPTGWAPCVCADVHESDRPCIVCASIAESAKGCRGCADELRWRNARRS